MAIKKTVGRPTKMDFRILIKIADAIQHNATIDEATRFAGVSRQTYYYYLNTNSVFAEKMAIAHSNKNKAVMSFLTTYRLN